MTHPSVTRSTFTAVSKLTLPLRTNNKPNRTTAVVQVSREEFDTRMTVINNEVELATHRIIFGVADPPDARRRYEAEYGNCRYTQEAIRTVAALSPLCLLYTSPSPRDS